MKAFSPNVVLYVAWTEMGKQISGCQELGRMAGCGYKRDTEEILVLMEQLCLDRSGVYINIHIKIA